MPEDQLIKCPYCAEWVQSEALICKHCHSQIAAPQLPAMATNDLEELSNAILRFDFSYVIAQLPAPQQAAYQGEVDRRRKHIGVAYLYHFLVGTFGAEKFYVGEPEWGAFYIFCTALIFSSVPLAIAGGLSLNSLNLSMFSTAHTTACVVVFICCWLVLTIAWTLDIILIPRQVNFANDKVRQKILLEIAQNLHPNLEPPTLPTKQKPLTTLVIALASVFFITGLLVATLQITPKTTSKATEIQAGGHSETKPNMAPSRPDEIYYRPGNFVSPMVDDAVYTPVGRGEIIRSAGFHNEGKSRTFTGELELAAKPNDQVFCLLDGIVVKSGYFDEKHGIAVEIYHPYPGVKTIYSHLQAYSVRPKDFVRRGRVIGYAGPSGSANKSMLGFSVVKTDTNEYIQPMAFLTVVGKYATKLHDARQKLNASKSTL